MTDVLLRAAPELQEVLVERHEIVVRLHESRAKNPWEPWALVLGRCVSTVLSRLLMDF